MAAPGFENPVRRLPTSQASQMSKVASSLAAPRYNPIIDRRQPAAASDPAAAAAATAAPTGFDLNSDPIFQKVQALDAANVAGARAQALAAEKQLAIRLGDTNGILDDKQTATEAQNNPYSILAQLRGNYQDTSNAHDEQLNKSNLFYSGARVNTLSRDANGYQQNVYNARQSALDQVSQIRQALVAAENAARAGDIQGLQDAYGRHAGQGGDTSTTTTADGSTTATPPWTPPQPPDERGSSIVGSLANVSKIPRKLVYTAS